MYRRLAVTLFPSFFRVPQVMVVHPSVPAKTVPEFIAYAKANPGKVNMASAGIGSVHHVAGELFKFMTGIDMIHVPYRGTTPALTDLLAGQAQVMFDVTTSSTPHIKAGRLRALAVTTAMCADVLPEVPVMGVFVPGYEASAWLGFGAPKDTPASIINMLNSEVNAGLADPMIKARFADLGAAVLPGSRPSSANLLRMIPRSGEKYSGQPTSRRSDPRPTFHNARRCLAPRLDSEQFRSIPRTCGRFQAILSLR